MPVVLNYLRARCSPDRIHARSFINQYPYASLAMVVLFQTHSDYGEHQQSRDPVFLNFRLNHSGTLRPQREGTNTFASASEQVLTNCSLYSNAFGYREHQQPGEPFSLSSLSYLSGFSRTSIDRHRRYSDACHWTNI